MHREVELLRLSWGFWLDMKADLTANKNSQFLLLHKQALPADTYSRQWSWKWIAFYAPAVSALKSALSHKECIIPRLVSTKNGSVTSWVWNFGMFPGSRLYCKLMSNTVCVFWEEKRWGQEECWHELLFKRTVVTIKKDFVWDSQGKLYDLLLFSHPREDFLILKMLKFS